MTDTESYYQRLHDVVYVASPYTHESYILRDLRAQAAIKYAAKLCKEGVICFCPIGHSHPFEPYRVPQDFEFWKRFNQPFLDLCTEMHVLMLWGWEESKGLAYEIENFQGASKKISYVDPDAKQL